MDYQHYDTTFMPAEPEFGRVYTGYAPKRDNSGGVVYVGTVLPIYDDSTGTVTSFQITRTGEVNGTPKGRFSATRGYQGGTHVTTRKSFDKAREVLEAELERVVRGSAKMWTRYSASRLAEDLEGVGVNHDAHLHATIAYRREVQGGAMTLVERANNPKHRAAAVKAYARNEVQIAAIQAAL